MRHKLGALLGLAVGDALGTSVEFKARGSFEPVTDMRGGGPFGLQPGEWTDDTSMALCMAASFIEHGMFNAEDQMDKYADWHSNGYMSSNGTCFDIGRTTYKSLQRWISYRIDPLCGGQGDNEAGNGSIMRLAPIPLFYADDPESAIHYAGESSKTTHGTRACIDACRYMAGIIIGALQGQSKAELLRAYYHPINGQWGAQDLHPDIAYVAGGTYKDKNIHQISSYGWVAATLEAALWAFYTTSTFEEGALAVVNLGDDADTTGAVYGQIAGAYYGVDAIPSKWLDLLAKKELIYKTVTDLCGI